MDMVKGIVARLHAAYPACEIYTEAIEQGFQPPCFSVRQLSGGSQAYPGLRYRTRQAFDVRYFPSGGRPQQECRAVAEALPETLAYLPDDAARGTGMEWEITDGVLHFFVQYAVFAREIRTQENMESLRYQHET